ncbi:MAG: alpha/beta hydrolase, partial [Gemmataceae bacterium]|nr:alpha/beta hydrolase [Gemmataceae bacterium]
MVDRRSFLAVAAGSPMALAFEGKTMFPAAKDLPRVEKLPDPLICFDGSRVADKDTWWNKRRPELRQLFQHYMYGYFPEKSVPIRSKVLAENSKGLNGKGTFREVEIRFGPEGTPPLYLLLAIPKKKKEKSPVFVGMNFAGNHTAVDDPLVRIPTVWMYDRYPGVEKNRATAKGRGTQKDVWNIEQSLEEGFALATFYSGDIDPDRADKREGIQPHFEKAGLAPMGKHAWGTIAAWSWGIMRAIDYLVADPELDPKKIVVVGHSRLGKTALLTAAFDDRVALAIPNQAGCGGTAPSRGKIGESVQRINTSFPHWFNGAFKEFNTQPEWLPFDQNGLVALCAPRPVLFTNAVEDTWANPEGQFEVLQAADPVYKFLGAEGLQAQTRPPLGELSHGALGYFIRAGKHSMTEV